MCSEFYSVLEDDVNTGNKKKKCHVPKSIVGLRKNNKSKVVDENFKLWTFKFELELYILP